MQNYYITENNKKIEIIDKKRIYLSSKNIKEIHIISLNKCKELYLFNNNLTIFKANLPNCEDLYLRNNCLTSFNTNLPNCKYLDLDNNNLKSFETYLSKIEYLDLDKNDLLYKRLNNKSTFYI